MMPYADPDQKRRHNREWMSKKRAKTELPRRAPTMSDAQWAEWIAAGKRTLRDRWTPADQQDRRRAHKLGEREPSGAEKSAAGGAPSPPSLSPFAGVGIMLGGNPDVWEQARALANEGYVQVVAVTPGTKAEFPCKVVTWVPPELEPAAGDMHQAEKQAEWDRWAYSKQPWPEGIIANYWGYGRFKGATAIVEAYYNEGWGLNFEEFKNYLVQGADEVIPLCGGYPAAGRSDEESARIYTSLAAWGGVKFAGFWFYAGEDYLTPECVEVIRSLKGRFS